MTPPLTVDNHVAVIGGGPGGLMAAEVLARAGASVTVFERMPSVGRKLLLAGRGGLNLTHTEALDAFLDRYGPARPRLEAALTAFTPDALRAWCADLGQPTFVGTSGRVFPEGFRATPLLRAWLQRLGSLGVELHTRQTWQGWTDDGELVFSDPVGATLVVDAAATVLALGGASWPRTGSDGRWTTTLQGAGVEVVPLQPANGGFVVHWSAPFRDRFAGTPLKNIRLSIDAASARGEAMVSAGGIEGGAVYALSRELRATMAGQGHATILVDLQPDLDVDQLAERLRHRRPKDSVSTALRRSAGLAPVAIGLLREATANDLPTDPVALAALAKALPLRLVGPQPIDRAISTAGGVALREVDDAFMLRRRPGTFVVGEMLDWDAPTGGYLLQATFATAVAAAHGTIEWLRTPRDRGTAPAPVGRCPDR